MGEHLPALTVASALRKIHAREWVLPAIQREFVWGPEAICSLFDSVMRDYPVGSLLLWDVDPQHAQGFGYYDFITDYHEKDSPYAPSVEVPVGQGVIAVLDGQQRLTALNIGLRGSHAERLPRKRSTNPDAYPVKRLYLNVLADAKDEDDGKQHDLRFLTPIEAEPTHEAMWFPVHKVQTFQDGGPAIIGWLQEHQLGNHPLAYPKIHGLWRAIAERASLSAYQEDSQNSDRVLDIFVRVNSGGAPLSYSDLLLSMATNQWKDRDARQEIRDLLKELATGHGSFAFSKDLVLKTGLYLCDVPDVAFKIRNFTQQNMATLEASWSSVREHLILAAQLLSRFGYSDGTLSAKSVVILVAYYLKHVGATATYLTSAADADDRRRVQRWVARSLIKRGIWGSGLDGLLRRLRDVIREADVGAGFPDLSLDEAMASLGKQLSFTVEELAEVANLEYGSARVFGVLAMLYPGLNLANEFHEDHLFPKSRFTKAKLVAAGLEPDQADRAIRRVNRVANIQLLEGQPNIEKRAKMPHEWLASSGMTAEQREAYVERNDLQSLPDSLLGFLEFYELRRHRVIERLATTLGVALTGVPEDEPDRPVRAGRSVVKHITEVLSTVPAGTAMKVGDIASRQSSEYPDPNDQVSSGAVASALDKPIPGVATAQVPRSEGSDVMVRGARLLG